MRVVVHDYSGHSFQVQLSRELARRGHEVLHVHSASYVTGKGAVERREGDPPRFSVESVGIGRPFRKYSAARRPLEEREYARRLWPHTAGFRPDVVLSSNMPLFGQQVYQADCLRAGYPFVFWQQDIYSFAMARVAEARLGRAGSVVGRVFVALERRLLERSDAIVTISEDFVPALLDWGMPQEKLHVVENWAPLEELPRRPRDNDWARHHELADKEVVLYSGNLGLKHDPELLLALAERFRDRPRARVVVVSQGPGADWLRGRPREHLFLLPYQPHEALPDVLGTGDVLAVILEPDAGAFSVPSKVLSYHCAGRPLLASIPRANLAARIVERNETGRMVEPGDKAAFAAQAETLLADDELRERLGRNARAYAERTFDIVAIGDRFETILTSVAETRR
jgi:colanic acid biosynthesis glycosyl transferase WcaI